MNARIRYGNEVDILHTLKTLEGQYIDPALEAFHSLGRTILSFSHRLNNLPDTDEFPGIMDDLGVGYLDEPMPGDPEPFRAIRFVEIIRPKPLEPEVLKDLARSMLLLSSLEGHLGQNGAYFFDHTVDPLGRIIDEI